MSHPHDSVLVKPLRLGGDGRIELFGHLYQGDAAVMAAGRRTVQVEVAPYPHRSLAVKTLNGAPLGFAERITDEARHVERAERVFAALRLVEDEWQAPARDHNSPRPQPYRGDQAGMRRAAQRPLRIVLPLLAIAAGAGAAIGWWLSSFRARPAQARMLHRPSKTPFGDVDAAVRTAPHPLSGAAK